MIKIRIDSENPVSREIDSCEIVDTNFYSDALTEEYFDVFMRALMGLSFTEKQIEETMIRMSKSFIERMKECEYEIRKVKISPKLEGNPKQVRFSKKSKIEEDDDEDDDNGICSQDVNDPAREGEA